ncbi:carbohydrate-binding module family 63 protein [Xylaria bambusicola]|uniref:carbohydrate-binding module family 63 protein n=1 Tax=Xylaria bambusicola TaxID=326684 RepID=UPI002008766B|nr:carbohydrate-binding module family 63 protein [Xylaria bambusicola]KAI0514819.1 carbohydrate-binding module family 63 protein [Xylaria bambusicola]
MRSTGAILALLAVPAAMACPRRPGTSITTAAVASTATPDAVSSSVSFSASPLPNYSSSSASSAVSASTALPVVASSNAVKGTSTFYGGNLNGGTCSFTTYSLPSGIYGTAFSGSAWNSAAHCGACLDVTANGKTITVMIVDKCPECDEGHLDLFEDAFNVFASSSTGLLPTSYTFVDCPISSPLVLHNKSGTSAYWFSMQVVNANEPVSKLEVSTDGGSTWKSTKRQDYNFFENPSGFGTDTVTVRVTSESGSTVTVRNVSVASDSQVTAGSNF